MKQHTLEELGLTKNESKVYLALLDLGTAMVGKIMKKAQTHRANAYDALHKLIERGLVSYITKGNYKVFQVTDPENLNRIIEQRQSQLSSVMPEFKLAYAMTKEEKSEASVHYGVRAFAKILHNLLDYNDDILVYGIPSSVPERIKFIVDQFHKKRQSMKITMKHIYNYDAKQRIKYLNTLKYTEARYLPEELDSNVTTQICKNEVNLIFWNDNLKIIRIMDPEIAAAYRRYFSILYGLAKQGIKETRDIATQFSDAYSKSAPEVLGDQHRYLLNTIESHLKDKDGTLLVIGCGGDVLPYSCQYTKKGLLGLSNKERIKNIIGNGKIIFLDYLLESTKGGLKKASKTLKTMGFFEEGFFKFNDFNTCSILKPYELDNVSITFLLNNIRDDLRIEDTSVDVIDANISIHHASVTRKELARVYSELFRILKPGGLLHLGEGEVDMNYSEDKLIKIGQDLSSIAKLPVLLSDEREKNAGYVVYSFFEPDKRYGDLPIISEPSLTNNLILVKVNEDGLVSFKTRDVDSEQFTGKLKEKGYKQVFTSGDLITLPLIDLNIQADYEKMICPINSFYDAIIAKARNAYAEIDDELVIQLTEGINIERENAKRGTVEYYMGQEHIVKTLKRIGFVDIQVIHRADDPFYNVVAKKPAKKM